MVLEKTLESPLDCKEIQPAHSEGDQPCYFFGRNDAKAETPLLWPPHAKSWLTGKDSDAGRDWGQEEKGMTEDEMASWTRWTWVLVNSGSWWWTGRPGVLRFMGLQRVGHDWATELNWTEQRSLRLSSVLFILFTLFCSSEVISTILSSSSLIRSSASDILLLIPSRVFLISVLQLYDFC